MISDYLYIWISYTQYLAVHLKKKIIFFILTFSLTLRFEGSFNRLIIKNTMTGFIFFEWVHLILFRIFLDILAFNYLSFFSLVFNIFLIMLPMNSHSKPYIYETKPTLCYTVFSIIDRRIPFSVAHADISLYNCKWYWRKYFSSYININCKSFKAVYFFLSQSIGPI